MAEEISKILDRPAAAAGTHEGDLIRLAVVDAVTALERKELPWNTADLELYTVNDQRQYTLDADLFGSSDAERVVLDATNATPIVVTTAAAHGLADGDAVRIAGVLGNTAANGDFLVANGSVSTFELTTLGGVNVAGTGAYTSGGIIDTTPFHLPKDFIVPVVEEWQIVDDTERYVLRRIDQAAYQDQLLGLVSTISERPSFYAHEGEAINLDPPPDKSYTVKGRYVRRLASASGNVLDKTETAGTWAFGGGEGDAYTSAWFHLQKGYDLVRAVATPIFAQRRVPKDARIAGLQQEAQIFVDRADYIEKRRRDTNFRRPYFPGHSTLFVGP
jgi:hypothetical protein